MLKTTLFAALCLSVGCAVADVCRWTDSKGVIHFSQRCDPNRPAERRWSGGTGRSSAAGAPARGTTAPARMSVSTRSVLEDRTVSRAPLTGRARPPVPPREP